MTASATNEPALNAELLNQPAHRAVRMVAYAKVADIGRGYDQLVSGDAEGLHDLRVAIRRLRTWLRAYRPFIDDALSKKTRRGLKQLAQSTSEARDTEVAAELVAAELVATEPATPRAMVPGFRDALRRLEKERDSALHDVRQMIDRELPSLLERLRRQLTVPQAPVLASLFAPPVASAVPVVSMHEAVAAVVELHKERLARAIGSVGSISDIDDAHRARIEAKRLRYILEPMYDEPHAKAAVAPLVALQDALGSARDAHVLAMRFVREVGEMAARDARQQALIAIGVNGDARRHPSFSRVRAGLVELARRSHVREVAAFDVFQREWSAERAPEALARVGAEFSVSG